MIKFTAKGRCARCEKDDPITTGSVGIPVDFSFDSDWDGFAKVAVFQGSGVSVDVALTGGSCTVPPEVLAEAGDELIIGVYGTNGEDGDDAVAIPTVYATAGRIQRGAEPSGIEPTPQTQPLIDQLLAAAEAAAEAAEDAEELAQSVRDDADAGAFDGMDGVSPRVSVKTLDTGETVVYVTDATGTHEYKLPNAVVFTTIVSTEFQIVSIPDAGSMLVAAQNGMSVFLLAQMTNQPPANTVNTWYFMTLREYTVDSSSGAFTLLFRTDVGGDEITISFDSEGTGTGWTYAAVNFESYIDGVVDDIYFTMGDLEDLQTTDKSSLVAAINEAAQSGGGGGGGGGTTDYADLSNKPSIEGVTLSGNKTAAQLGLAKASDIPSLSGYRTAAAQDVIDGAQNRAINAIKGIFWCTYGTTTSAEIQAALDDGKMPCVMYNDYQYIYVANVNGTYAFASNLATVAKRLGCNNDVWSYYTTALYTKPSGGIPKTDLASAVQTSLGKADTALQSYTETDPTVPSWAKAAQKPSYTASEVGAAPAVTEVTVSTAGAVTQALDAGKIYHFSGALTSLAITLTAAGAGIIPQYHFDFDSGSTAPTVTVTGATWPDGSFTPEANKHYEVDILNGYAVVMAW